jgi:hypothetical protein
MSDCKKNFWPMMHWLDLKPRLLGHTRSCLVESFLQGNYTSIYYLFVDLEAVKMQLLNPHSFHKLLRVKSTPVIRNKLWKLWVWSRFMTSFSTYSILWFMQGCDKFDVRYSVIESGNESPTRACVAFISWNGSSH